VRYVLEGSVRKIGNRVRITSQLIDAANAAHVWAERYDRALDDIFALHHARLAIATGGDDPTALAAAAFVVGSEDRDYPAAFDAFDQALALSPSSFLALSFGRFEEAALGEPLDAGQPTVQPALRHADRRPGQSGTRRGGAGERAAPLGIVAGFHDQRLCRGQFHQPRASGDVRGCAAPRRVARGMSQTRRFTYTHGEQR
jgi:hypothetical protein